MRDWNKQRKIFIPGMKPPKTYTCKVCESEIIPAKNAKYVARERVMIGGMGAALNGSSTEPRMFDCFDCPVCGCQLVARERLQKVDQEGEGGEINV